MLKLSELKPKAGSKKKLKRVGRGTSSGWGKTCGRGHKGQASRSGGTKGSRFEGGQTPIYRRLPKRGFTNYPFSQEFEVVNVGSLAKLGKAEVRKADLGISKEDLLKILGDGKLEKALTIYADKFSKSARQKIEASGGKCVVLSEVKNA